MKVIIAGGRKWESNDDSWSLVNLLHQRYWFTEIVSGMCSGADAFGEEWAHRNSITLKQMPAKWDDFTEPCKTKYRGGAPYNAMAGPNRNKKMAQYADAVILFKGGKGTNSMRILAKQYGVRILYDEKWGEIKF